jgi:Holliday junction resolvasome RuvABC endonuclease subunit
MSRPLAYIGADPGMSGALAIYIPDPIQGLGVLAVEDMPALEIDGKRQMDMWKLAHILTAWVTSYDVRNSAVERVHSMPKQGVSSSFNFGFAAGALQQAIASAGLPLTLIQPATWKAIYGLRGGRENKDMSRQKASQMFPAFSHLWARKKDEGRAEAVLLAHYASKLQEAGK